MDRTRAAIGDGAAVGRVVSAWTGVPVGKMRSDQMKAMLDLAFQARAVAAWNKLGKAAA